MKYTLGFKVKDEVERKLIRDKFERNQTADALKDHFLEVVDFFNYNKHKLYSAKRFRERVIGIIEVRVFGINGYEHPVAFKIHNEQWEENIRLCKDTSIKIPYSAWEKIRSESNRLQIEEPIVDVIVTRSACEKKLITVKDVRLVLAIEDLIKEEDHKSKEDTTMPARKRYSMTFHWYNDETRKAYQKLMDEIEVNEDMGRTEVLESMFKAYIDNDCSFVQGSTSNYLKERSGELASILTDEIIREGKFIVKNENEDCTFNGVFNTPSEYSELFTVEAVGDIREKIYEFISTHGEEAVIDNLNKVEVQLFYRTKFRLFQRRKKYLSHVSVDIDDIYEINVGVTV